MVILMQISLLLLPRKLSRPRVGGRLLQALDLIEMLHWRIAKITLNLVLALRSIPGYLP